MLASKALTNSTGIIIEDMISDEAVIWRWSDEQKQHIAQIGYARNGRPYFRAGRLGRQYLDEYIRYDR